MPVASPDRPRRGFGRWLTAAFLLIWGAVAVWQTHKPLLAGTHVSSAEFAVPLSDVAFVADITAADGYGRPVLSQAIFDEMLGVVRSARHFLVLDYFLFNDQRLASGVPTRALSRELRDALIERKQADPALQILLIVDPINELYGAVPSQNLALLHGAGVQVVVTDLDPLRDSNFLYSSLWRLGVHWWDGDARGEGWLPNPLDESASRITLRAWARLINFKANHRKVAIGDDGHGGLIGIVGSANPHDASSAHSNVALKVQGSALEPLLASELAIARFSGWQGTIASVPANQIVEKAELPNTAKIQILTEAAIRSSLLQHLNAASRGDSIDIAMFYLSERSIIDALLAAARRGVAVRLILDPNKDAFGHVKSGIPNRPVASELVSASDGAIHVRWYRTHGEQFHPKLVAIYGADRLWLTLGSANLTRRNLDDYNLEANIGLDVPRNSPLAAQVLEYFDTLWSNRAALGIEYTADFDVYSDPAQSHYWLYRIMEATGLSTF